ncbi:MAG: SDR family NAD(P)-dependent oxidoreductase [Verrucomicrobiota bacterium]
MGRLEGKVAWISGATSGIGEATASLFAGEGAKVALIGRRVALSRRIAAELKAQGGEALPVACDVSNERQVRDSIRRTVERFGRLDILVNNAGMVHVKLLHKYTEREWDHVMGVNVKSMFFAVKHAMPHLRRAGRSYIVNIGSISSFVGQALTPVYTTTKHAIVGLTKSIALDYAADGIRCNCVCPGITDTPMLRKHLNVQPDPEAALAGRLRRVPMGVPLTPHDVARTILFLSCEDSSGITGTTLTIDAGYLTAAEWDSQGRTAFATGSNNAGASGGRRRASARVASSKRKS